MIKMNRLYSAIGAMLLAGALCGPASAQEGRGIADYARSFGFGDMKMMAMMDKNGDHVVTKKEYMDFHSKLFDMMDTKKTGKLTADDWMNATILGKQAP
jgi:hypothetical protein